MTDYAATTAAPKAFAKVILLTKDEGVLIEDFLTYYGELFGYANVVVVDNGSTDERVLAVYERYTADKGVTVIRELRAFEAAREFMTEHMLALAPTCDWLLPLETDEFVYALRDPLNRSDGNPLSSSNDVLRLGPDDVHAYLRSLPADVSVVNYGAVMASVVDPADAAYDSEAGAYPRPPADMTTFRDQGWDKLIVRASQFSHMQQWCHHAAVLSGTRVKSDFLGLLHFHETGFRRKIESAVRVLRAFPYIENVGAIAEPPSIDKVRRDHRACRRWIAKRVACGHKLEYYDEYLRRVLALRAFRDVLGRLPRDPEELHGVASDLDDPEVAVLRKKFAALNEAAPAAACHASASLTPSWDALLFNDWVPKSAAPPPEECVQIRQVADFFVHLAATTAASKQTPPPAAHATFEDALRKYASDHNETGTDKTTSHAYGPLYSHLFDPMRERDAVDAVLEIGVYSGASVQAMSEFFPDAAIVGVDVTLDRVRFGRDNPMVTFVQGDGTDPALAESLGTQFDIIIEDASHAADDQVAAVLAFGPYLAPGGLFVIEDISGQQDLAALRERLEAAAKEHGLETPIGWYDLRAVKGQFDDIVAVIRRPPS
jgi:predicted O-methyltransferase YrrM